MGGKSRKSGGVSKKLILQIKNGNLTKFSNKKCNPKSNETNSRKLLFDED